MMGVFVALAALLVAAALALIWLGLRSRSSEGAEAKRTETNLEALRAEYRQLQSERDAGRISEDEFAESRGELERRVLEETRSTEALEREDRREKRRTLAFIAVFLPFAAALIYWRFGTWDAFNPEIAQMQAQHSRGHSMSELDAQLSNLEKSLQENPANVNGWLLFARTNDALKRYDKAAGAYEKLAGMLSGAEKAQILADWADCLAAQKGGLDGRPEQLVDEAIALDAHLWKALALKGTALYNRKDYKGASKVWERLLADQKPGTEDWANVVAMVNDAREKAGMPLLKETPSVTRMEKTAAPEAAPSSAVVAVSGTVSLAPELKERVRGDETVFVFARPVSGSRMPVAVLQCRVSDLPYRFALDSTMRLPGGMGGMETMKSVIVGARISRSGNLMPQSGDLEGETPAVAVGSSSLSLKITRAIP